MSKITDFIPAEDILDLDEAASNADLHFGMQRQALGLAIAGFLDERDGDDEGLRLVMEQAALQEIPWEWVSAWWRRLDQAWISASNWGYGRRAG